MKTFFNIVLLSVFLISCSKNDQESSSKKSIKNQQGQSQKKYFSEDVKYLCEENSSCRDEIKLIAIKEEDKISKCTGVSVDNAIFFDANCLSGKKELSLEFCENNIEIHNLKNEITKCESIEVVYTSSENVKFYKMTDNSNENSTVNQNDASLETESLKSYYIVDDKQTSEKCEQSFTSLLNFKSLLSNSEFLDFKKCKFFEGGVIFKADKFSAISQEKIKENFFTAINALCLLESCEQKTYSQKEKAIEALKASDYETVSNMIGYILSGRSVQMQDYNMLENSLKYDTENRVFSVAPQKICRWEPDVKRMMVLDINAELSLSELSELFSDTDYYTTFLYGYNLEKLMFLEMMASNVVIPQSNQPTVFHEGRWYEAFFPAQKYERDDFLLASSEEEYGRAEDDSFVLLGAESSHQKIISAPVCE